MTDQEGEVGADRAGVVDDDRAGADGDSAGGVGVIADQVGEGGTDTAGVLDDNRVGGERRGNDKQREEGSDDRAGQGTMAVSSSPLLRQRIITAGRCYSNRVLNRDPLDT